MRHLSCVVIGDAAVTIRCAEILVERGHPVLGIVTGDGRVAAWAAEQGVRCRFEADPRAAPLGVEDVAELAGGGAFDVLWSIYNLRILTPEVLSLPRLLALNYHDALLPRYAGLHATSWAILAGERSHGITWHRMTPRVDAGDVLLQRRVPIEPDDTAWTLNGRCTEAAIDSFPELVDALAADRLAPRAQEAGARTWFAGWRRPAPACVIPWDAPAERVSAFVRALDFGAADNPLGLPKLLTPGGALFAHEVELLDRRSGEAPGTVLAAGAEGIEIATGSQDVRVRVAGGEISCSGLAPGVRLPAAAPEAERLAARERSLLRHEGFWAAALGDLAPLAVPGFAETGDERRVELEVPALGPDCVHALLAAFLFFLAREIGQPFDVALGEPALRRELEASGWTGLFALRPPLRVDPGGRTLAAFSVGLREERHRRQERGTYPIDLPARLRRLHAPVTPAVAVDLLDEGESLPGPTLEPGVTLAASISHDGRRLILRAPQSSPLDDLARRFLAKTSDRSVGSDRSESVSDLFRARVARDPEALALEVGDERWSYRQLAERAERLAAALRRRGAGPESLIALRLQRLPDLVTGLLGVHEAGAAFVVLDPLDSPRRLSHILEEARPLFALGDAGMRRLAGGLPVHPIALAAAPEGPPLPDPPCRAERSGLAYVAFTSGSTGVPKGVAIEHGALAHYIAAAGRRFGLVPGDRVLQLGSPAFDLAYEQIFGALCHGATLVGLPGPHLPEPRELLAACERLGVTVLDLPTAVWESLAREIMDSALALPAALRLVVIGGEQAQTRTVRGFLRASQGRVRLLNTYGPTECTIVATWWEAPVAARDLGEDERIPIGRPVEGIEAHILDPATGELWLGGAGLARGYHRRPELTAARFVEVDGLRLYRTGDRARWREDGELELLGRVDRQVKIAGRRVEPGEVEATLREIPGVAAAAVLPVAEEGGPVRLASWVVLRQDGNTLATLSGVREQAARLLPPFLRPSRITVVESLPRTPAGKVDLHALREIATAPVEPPRADVRDPIEASLAALWGRLLGLGGDGAISRDDDFFDLGGDSLAAITLLAAIEKSWGRRLHLAGLHRTATLAALADEIRRAPPLAPASPACLVDLQPLGQAPPIVCVHGLGGHLLRLIPLARALAPDQPFLGLQSPGLDDDEPVPLTIEALARVFLAELSRRLGSGPYHLCGMSFGGIVAFEMARQLAESGSPPASLVLFDSDLAEILPGRRPAQPAGLAKLRGRLRRFLGDHLGHSRRLIRRLRRGQDDIQKANEYHHFTRVLRANEAALARYVPGPYPRKVVYLVATERDPAIFRDFIERTGCDLEIVPVPGDHLGMLESPHVERLAAELRRRMTERAGCPVLP